MSQPPSSTSGDRAALRQRWLERAATAFDQMFAEDKQSQLITFDQREDLACELGQLLAAFLLEEHVQRDPLVRPDDEVAPGCPKCGRPAVRVSEPDEPLVQREMITRAGPVQLHREQWRCATCRVAFFPSGSTPATGQ